LKEKNMNSVTTSTSIKTPLFKGKTPLFKQASHANIDDPRSSTYNKFKSSVNTPSSSANSFTPVNNKVIGAQFGNLKKDPSSIKKDLPPKSPFGASKLSANNHATHTPNNSYSLRAGHPLKSATKHASDNEIINPIVDGVDYSDMIAKKPLLGYFGPGYIVKYSCADKYLKGLTVPKGLYKLIDHPSTSEKMDKLLKGPMLLLKPINDRTETPTKITEDMAKSYRDFLIDSAQKESRNSMALNLEIDFRVKEAKVKKCIKWADLVHDISKINSPAIKINDVEEKVDDTTQVLIDNSFKSKMRRSFSCSDMQKMVLTQDDHEPSPDRTSVDPDIDRLTKLYLVTSNKDANNLNQTYDKSPVSQLTVQNVESIYKLSPSKVVCSSFLENSSHSDSTNSIKSIDNNTITVVSGKTDDFAELDTSPYKSNLSSHGSSFSNEPVKNHDYVTVEASASDRKALESNIHALISDLNHGYDSFLSDRKKCNLIMDQINSMREFLSQNK